MTYPVMKFTDESGEQAIFTALGAASMCWENVAVAGVFNSELCAAIGNELVAYLRHLRLLPDPATATATGDPE